MRIMPREKGDSHLFTCGVNVKRWLSPFLVAAAIAPLQGQAQPVFRVERPVVTDGAGPRRLAVDVGLLAGAAPFATQEPIDTREGRRWRAHGGLSDFRLYDASTREVPYLLIYPQEAAAQFATATPLPIAATEKTSGFEADLGSPRLVDAIQVEGLPAPFLKRLTLEGSGDRERWTLLAGEGTLFHLPQERLRQTLLPFATGSYRYLRVTWNDTNSGRMPMPSVVLARLALSATPDPRPLTADGVIEQQTAESGRTRYRVRLPAARLPLVALRLEPAGGHVFRQATVVESTLQDGRFVTRTIGRATLSRVVRDGLTAEDMRIPVTATREPFVDLFIDNGNNPPLALTRVVLEFAELPWIYFESPGGTLTARYGSPSLPAPRYDLEAVRASIEIDAVKDARWGELGPATSSAPQPQQQPTAATPSAGASIDVKKFRYKRALPPGPAGLVVLPLDAAVLAHSRGPGPSFGDVRVVDEHNKQIPYLVERLEPPLTVDLELHPAKANARELAREGGPTRSLYSVDLPYADLPSPRLSLETSARTFTRGVAIGVDRPADRNHRDPWFLMVNAGDWTHADEGQPAPPFELAVNPGSERQLLVVVTEGDNAPLPITRARLLLPSYRLRFFHPGKPLTLMYDRTFEINPTYDLELLAPQLMGAEAREITAAPEAEGSGGGVKPLISPAVFWAGLGIAVLVLGALIVKLMRSTQPGT
jgi:hypothetical protein